MNRTVVACLVSIGSICGLAKLAQAQEFAYRGMCDASAAVALDAGHFVVANDERNTLRVYKRGQSDPVDSVPIFEFLKTKEKKESDLEGAARVGSRIYWISSHGTNSEGEVQERRYRLFATEITTKSGIPTVKTIGSAPYTRLLADLSQAKQLAKYDLSGASKKPPKSEGGLNIEGLAATPQGELLIGFRNPIPNKKALLVPLKNPAAVIEGKSADLGDPIELDLGQRGIRSVEHVGDSYLIVAGPIDEEKGFSLYRWSGPKGGPPVEIQGIEFKGLQPEALFAIPGTNKVQMLSDDGGEMIGAQRCKEIDDEAQQAFRSTIVSP
jgi:hypothetical protein